MMYYHDSRQTQSFIGICIAKTYETYDEVALYMTEDLTMFTQDFERTSDDHYSPIEFDVPIVKLRNDKYDLYRLTDEEFLGFLALTI